MSKKWNKGPPPSVGWWQASVCGKEKTLRWWNGIYWSEFVNPSDSARFAARRAKMKAPDFIQGRIEWLERPASWPARSRT